MIQYDSEHNPVLLGIASLAHKCGIDKVPSVFVRVSAYLGTFYPTDQLDLVRRTQAMLLNDDERIDPAAPSSPPHSAADAVAEDVVVTTTSQGGSTTMSTGVIVLLTAAVATCVLVAVMATRFYVRRRTRTSRVDV